MEKNIAKRHHFPFSFCQTQFRWHLLYDNKPATSQVFHLDNLPKVRIRNDVPTQKYGEVLKASYNQPPFRVKKASCNMTNIKIQLNKKINCKLSTVYQPLTYLFLMTTIP